MKPDPRKSAQVSGTQVVGECLVANLILFQLIANNLYIVDDDLPDSFFEHTESDIRKMWADLQSK